MFSARSITTRYSFTVSPPSQPDGKCSSTFLEQDRLRGGPQRRRFHGFSSACICGDCPRSSPISNRCRSVASAHRALSCYHTSYQTSGLHGCRMSPLSTQPHVSTPSPLADTLPWPVTPQPSDCIAGRKDRVESLFRWLPTSCRIRASGRPYGRPLTRFAVFAHSVKRRESPVLGVRFDPSDLPRDADGIKEVDLSVGSAGRDDIVQHDICGGCLGNPGSIA